MARASCENAPRSVELRIVSHPAHLAKVRRAVEQLAEVSGFDQASRDEIGLCVNEALANVMRHAYDGAQDQPIQIVARCAPEGIEITIRDWGNGVDPLAAPRVKYDPLKGGGVGLICLKELMDEVVFRPQGDGMLLTMRRRKERGARPVR